MELMDGVMEYIRPELLVLVAVLYIVGKALKASQDVKDKHIRSFWAARACSWPCCGWWQPAASTAYRALRWACLPVSCRAYWWPAAAYTPISSSNRRAGRIDPNAKEHPRRTDTPRRGCSLFSDILRERTRLHTSRRLPRIRHRSRRTGPPACGWTAQTHPYLSQWPSHIRICRQRR